MKMRNESGRSMVEMLGVLAIIGVLSVGGISGYTMAMNRYRANEVIDMATKYAVVVFSGYETNLAINGGKTVNYEIPSFANTGLTENSKVNGVTIETAKLYSKVSCDTAIGVTKTTPTAVSAKSVEIVLDFGTTGAGVCKAAASSLGVSCAEGNKVTYCINQS